MGNNSNWFWLLFFEDLGTENFVSFHVEEPANRFSMKKEDGIGVCFSFLYVISNMGRSPTGLIRCLFSALDCLDS